MLTRLEFEIDHFHGRRLGPSIMTFHVQLAWRNWLVLQLDSGETESISPPDFGAGLSMLETQNNLMWLPSVTNVPLLLSLSLGGGRTPAPAPVVAIAPAVARSPAAARAPASTPPGGLPGAPAAHRSVRNTGRHAMFTVNTPFSRNVRARRVSKPILLAGTPPGVSRSGATGPVCVSWHAKGLCYDDCARASDHGVLNAEERLEFHAWCQIA
jgi:hypothetical protein